MRVFGSAAVLEAQGRSADAELVRAGFREASARADVERGASGF